jgi:hypothetical protein
MRRRRFGPPLVPGLRWLLLALLLVVSVGGFYRWLAQHSAFVQRSTPAQP